MLTLLITIPTLLAPACAAAERRLLLQGAVADLQKVIALEPRARQQQYAAELSALQARGQAVTLQAQAAAEAGRLASRTVSESCMIEEIGDEPEAEQQVG